MGGGGERAEGLIEGGFSVPGLQLLVIHCEFCLGSALRCPSVQGPDSRSRDPLSGPPASAVPTVTSPRATASSSSSSAFPSPAAGCSRFSSRQDEGRQHQLRAPPAMCHISC